MTTMMKHEGQDIGFDAMEASMAFRATTGLDTSVTSRDTTVPIDLEWRDLTFDVPVGREKNRKSSKLAPELVADTPPPMSDGGSTPVKSGTRRVLHGINGQVRSGQVLAIMGASGSGKTTMLNMLSGRMKSSNKCNAGGKILVNGRQRDFNTFRHIAKFVEQDDTTMFAELTVREQIVYAARLSLPNSVPEDRKIVRVEKIIQELGLSKCADTYIGSEIVRGVSGGERRRASIGIELVTDPSLIFLDEPTTGLDSFNAMNVMASLRHLARNGRTIVTTIHQPRSSIFHMFDFLCLIAEGRTVYFGPASEAAAYFGRIGFHMPTTFNVADYAIDVLSIDRRSSTKETKSMARIQYIANHYSTNVEPGLLEEWANNPHADIDQSNNARLNFGNNLLREFQILAMRTFLLMSREKQINFTRLGQTLFFGVVLGLVWLNSGREDTPGDRFAIQGVIFFICVNQCFDAAFGIIFSYPAERAITNRERSSGYYRDISYFVGKQLCELPRALFFNVLMLVIVYFMAGLRESAGAFFTLLFITVLLSLGGEGLSQTISVFTGNEQAAAGLVPVAVIFQVLFGGFFILPSALPSYIAWLRWASFVYFGYQAGIINEFSGTDNETDKVVLDSLESSLSKWSAIGILIVYVALLKFLYFITLVANKPRFDRRI